jgi:hypothetical protein
VNPRRIERAPSVLWAVSPGGAVPENEVGRTYARPRSGTARRPEKNASARPTRGALQRCLFPETGGFDLDQQPKRREIALVRMLVLSVLHHVSSVVETG